MASSNNVGSQASAERAGGGRDLLSRLKLNSLNTRLVLLFLLLSIIPLIIVQVVSNNLTGAAADAQVDQELQQINRGNADFFLSWISERKDNVTVMAGLVQSQDLAEASKIIKRYADQWKFYEDIALIGTDGFTKYRITGTTSIDTSTREYFLRAMKGETVFVGPVVSKATGNIIFNVAAPVKVDGKVTGVVMAAVPTTNFVKLLQDSRTGKTGETYLVTQDSLIGTPSRFPEELKRTKNITTTAELQLKVETDGARAGLGRQDGRGALRQLSGHASDGRVPADFRNDLGALDRAGGCRGHGGHRPGRHDVAVDHDPRDHRRFRRNALYCSWHHRTDRKDGSDDPGNESGSSRPAPETCSARTKLGSWPMPWTLLRTTCKTWSGLCKRSRWAICPPSWRPGTTGTRSPRRSCAPTSRCAA